MEGVEIIVAGQIDLCLEKRPAASEGAFSVLKALNAGDTASLGGAAAHDAAC